MIHARLAPLLALLGSSAALPSSQSVFNEYKQLAGDLSDEDYVRATAVQIIGFEKAMAMQLVGPMGEAPTKSTRELSLDDALQANLRVGDAVRVKMAKVIGVQKAKDLQLLDSSSAGPYCTDQASSGISSPYSTCASAAQFCLNSVWAAYAPLNQAIANWINAAKDNCPVTCGTVPASCASAAPVAPTVAPTAAPTTAAPTYVAAPTSPSNSCWYFLPSGCPAQVATYNIQAATWYRDGYGEDYANAKTAAGCAARDQSINSWCGVMDSITSFAP